MREPEGGLRPGRVTGRPGLPPLPAPGSERGSPNLAFHRQPCWDKDSTLVPQLRELLATSSTEGCGRMLLATSEKSNKMLHTSSVKKMFYLKC